METVVFRLFDNKNARKEDERLSRFVSFQRTLNKQDKVPPKRRELLDEIGFVWDAQAGSSQAHG